MRKENESVDVPDPADVAAAHRWAAAMRAAVASAQGHAARLAQIDAQLNTPARLAVAAELTAAQEADTTASTTLSLATDAQSAANTVVAHILNVDLPQAQAALDTATRAVSDKLGVLMAQASTSATLSATVDGLALRERYRTGAASTPPLWDMATIPFRAHTGDQPIDPQINLPVIGSPEHAAVLAVLDALDERVDGIADLISAEGVHQLVGGNLARSGAALEMAASGTVTDHLDVTSTPVRAHDVTHRVLVLDTTTPQPAWEVPEPSVLAAADPAYASWLTGLLPDPATVRIGAAGLDESGATLATVDLTAADLALDGPAWLRVAADTGELAARVAAAARTALIEALDDAVNHPGTDVAARIAITAPTTLADQELDLDALLAAARSARALVGSARTLGSDDLAPLGATGRAPSASVVNGVVTRVRATQRSLAQLDADLDGAETLAESELVALLLRASEVGLAEATPDLGTGPVDISTLRAQAAAARLRLAPRVAVPTFAPGATPVETLDAARELLGTLCGAPVLLMVPVEVPDFVHTEDLDTGRTQLPGADPAAVRDWLSDHARVRTPVAALTDALDIAAAVGATFGATTGAAVGAVAPRATQLPRPAEAIWAGIDPAPPAGLVDLVVVRTDPGGDLPATVSGLAVDSWTQTVPASVFESALAFHYDEPNSDPPQAVLVAVPPDLSDTHAPQAWDLGSVMGAVTSAVALARGRAVAADLVADAVVRIAGEQ